MAYEGDNPFSLNILAVSDLIENSVNKTGSFGDQGPEGKTGEPEDVLDLPMSDSELLKLRDGYEKIYAPYEKEIKDMFARNLRSYLGRNNLGQVPGSDEVTAANLQFEAEETFIPAVFAQQPAPFTYADNTPEGNKLSDDVETMLQYHADQLVLNRRLALMVRQWSIYQLGVLKPGWNEKIKDVTVDNRKIQDFVFKPDGFVDAYGDFVGWLGERITVTAEVLIDLYPAHKEYIKKEVQDKLGTDVTYTEWWNDEYCFSTFKERVLDKHKNQYFNHPVKAAPDPLTGMVPQQKRNHFAIPKKPYVFLSVFSLQERPHDITGLIEQNIPNQSLITRRVAQIDDNLSQSNNGIVFSENNFNQETAKQASNALTRGVGKVLVPAGGPIGEAIVRIAAADVPNGFFDDLNNAKNALKSSWGTQGIASQEQKPDETARGMVLNQGRDTSRIGGGIGDVVEQAVARSVFNWLVQLYMVFYDEPHVSAVMGQGKATEYVTLSAQNIDRQLIVGVAPNSMKPKDEVAKMNQATQLFQAGAIGPKVYLEALDFPNPDESAADGALWQVDKGMYMQLNFPELWAQVQQIAQQQAQAQQQQMAQQQAQEGQLHQQQVGQKEQDHQQKMRHGEEGHQAKMQQTKDMASAKLGAIKLPK